MGAPTTGSGSARRSSTSTTLPTTSGGCAQQPVVSGGPRYPAEAPGGAHDPQPPARTRELCLRGRQEAQRPAVDVGDLSRVDVDVGAAGPPEVRQCAADLLPHQQVDLATQGHAAPWPLRGRPDQPLPGRSGTAPAARPGER